MPERRGPSAGSRTAQESNGGYIIFPTDIAERYGLGKGDQVFWTDSPEEESRSSSRSRRYWVRCCWLYSQSVESSTVSVFGADCEISGEYRGVRYHAS